MESTGVYWKPLFNLLEGQVKVMPVDPTHLRQVPGRKTDVRDCEWLAQLLEHGLLRGSFIPPQQIRDLRNLRDLTRYHRKLVGGAAAGDQPAAKDFRGRQHQAGQCRHRCDGRVRPGDFVAVVGRRSRT